MAWASAAETSWGDGKARSVIFLWMAGGVTHIDSFDPKPDAAGRNSRHAWEPSIPTCRASAFVKSMPGIARQAHRLAVVRSYSHDSDDHFLSQAYALSGRKVTAAQLTTEPNIGSIVAKLQGPRGGLPGYIAVPGTTRPGPPPKNLFTGGWLGDQYAPFGTGGVPRNEDFTAKVAEASGRGIQSADAADAAGHRHRPTDAVALAGRTARRSLRDIDRQGPGGVFDVQFQEAFNMLTAPAVRQAFDLTRESDAVRDHYGRTKIGQRCLLARRLVEAKARFVMVDYGYDPEYGNLWDNHRGACSKTAAHLGNGERPVPSGRHRSGCGGAAGGSR